MANGNDTTYGKILIGILSKANQQDIILLERISIRIFVEKRHKTSEYIIWRHNISFCDKKYKIHYIYPRSSVICMDNSLIEAKYRHLSESLSVDKK